MRSGTVPQRDRAPANHPGGPGQLGISDRPEGSNRLGIRPGGSAAPVARPPGAISTRRHPRPLPPASPEPAAHEGPAAQDREADHAATRHRPAGPEGNGRAPVQTAPTPPAPNPSQSHEQPQVPVWAHRGGRGPFQERGQGRVRGRAQIRGQNRNPARVGVAAPPPQGLVPGLGCGAGWLVPFRPGARRGRVVGAPRVGLERPGRGGGTRLSRSLGACPLFARERR